MRPPVYAFPPCEFLIQEFLESDKSPPRDLPIFYNYHCKNLPPNTKLIYYNIEQLTRQNELDIILQVWFSGRIAEIWDYSAVNCEILRKYLIPCRHIPFTLTEKRLALYRPLVFVKKEYDVGFCGHLSPRRRFILEELLARGVSVFVLTAVFDGRRDRELAKCRIILNIHFADDYQIFERSRCETWLEIGVPVVSETSIDNDPRAFCFPYNTITDETVLLLSACRYP